MKFDIINLLIGGVLVFGSFSCAREQPGVDANEAADAANATNQIPTLIQIPTPPPFHGTPQPFSLKGTLVFQRDGKLEDISTGQKTPIVLRDGFSADGWNMSADGTKMCFSQIPNDVEFFDAGAIRNYLFTANFDVAPRVLLAAYGARAKEYAYNYGNPVFAKNTQKVIVNEFTVAQFIDDPTFLDISIYDIKTRKRMWKSDEFVEKLPATDVVKTHHLAGLLSDGVLSPDGEDMICLAKRPCAAPDEVPTYLMHVDLKNHRTEVLDCFADTVSFGSLGGNNSYAQISYWIDSHVVWHPTKKQFLWLKPIYGSRNISDRDKTVNTELFSFDLKTKRSRRLTTNSKNDSSPQWSLDGKTIIWLREGQIFSAYADGSKAHAILPQLQNVVQIQLLPKIPDWSRYRELGLKPLAGKDK